MAERKGLNRRAILEAAVGLVEAEGLPALTLQELARRLQVRTASLYNHIQGIAEVRQHIALLSLHELDAAIRDAAVGRSYKEALEAVALAYRSFAQQHPHLYETFIGSARWEDPEVDDTRRDVVRVLTQVLSPYCGEVEMLHFNRGFRSLLHGFVSLESAGFFKKGMLDESFHFAIQSFIAALPLQNQGGEGHA